MFQINETEGILFWENIKNPSVFHILGEKLIQVLKSFMMVESGSSTQDQIK